MIRYDSTKSPSESLRLLKETLIKSAGDCRASNQTQDEFLWCVNDTDVDALASPAQQRALVYQLYREHVTHEIERFAEDMERRNRWDMYDECIELLKRACTGGGLELDVIIDELIKLRRLFTSTQMNMRDTARARRSVPAFVRAFREEIGRTGNAK
jgi:hypothetical protein